MTSQSLPRDPSLPREESLLQGQPRFEEQTPLDPATLERMNAYWRAANYLSVGQIYLKDNALLRRPLRQG